MNPETGVRFELSLLTAEKIVSYSCEVQLPGSTVFTQADVVLASGEVTFHGGSEVPQWVESTIRGLLRSFWRSCNAQQTQQPWPRRLTRWRAGQ
jgi:hypothetical protein